MPLIVLWHFIFPICFAQAQEEELATSLTAEGSPKPSVQAQPSTAQESHRAPPIRNTAGEDQIWETDIQYLLT